MDPIEEILPVLSFVTFVNFEEREKVSEPDAKLNEDEPGDTLNL